MEYVCKVKNMSSVVSQPLVSMVIPSFNHGQFVKACIESIIAQDYKNIELIIIDDGSTDNSVHKIESMLNLCRDRFSRFEFRSRSNKGLSETLNEALDWSRGKYFAAIASDDLLFSNKTSSLLTHIDQEEDIAGVFGGCVFIDQVGSSMGKLSPLAACYKFVDVISNKHIILAPSQLLRLKLVKEVGCYPVGLYIEDWYMWLALTKNEYKLKVIPDILVQYRQHEFNISKNALKMFESRKWILGCFKDHPLCEYAMAQIHVSAAIDFSGTLKKQSAKYLVKAISCSPRIFLTLPFVSCFARLIVPRFFIEILARIKIWLRTNSTAARHSW